jgi:hypothetical protein
MIKNTKPFCGFQAYNAKFASHMTTKNFKTRPFSVIVLSPRTNTDNRGSKKMAIEETVVLTAAQQEAQRLAECQRMGSNPIAGELRRRHFGGASIIEETRGGNLRINKFRPSVKKPATPGQP